MRKLILAAVMAMSTSITYANEYDNCVLSHLPGTTSDYAAKSIIQSCIRVTEQEIPIGSINFSQWSGYSSSTPRTSSNRLVPSIAAHLLISIADG